MGSRRDTPPLDVDDYASGVLSGDRAILARAITLVESQRAEDRTKARELIERLLPKTGQAIRLGVSGIPGAGKSTFIDAFGTMVLARGHKLAVLAVDPSSAVSGGSILGDKTRMHRLARDPLAFIRPSPSAGTLGGVARRTREAALLCEAAGCDFIIVETMGVGQSETIVADMVDHFLLLTVAGGGDDLQGIKRGVLEVADVIAVNKADGEGKARAERARKELASALHLLRADSAPPVFAVSALEGTGLDDVMELVESRHRERASTGALDAARRRQAIRWMWALVEDRVLSAFRQHPAVQARVGELTRDVESGETTPGTAADELVRAFGLD